jgi:hypothetical protein
MSENMITLSDKAVRLIKSDVTAFKSDGKRYAEYVTEMNVTRDTVAEHVALFRDAFKAATKNASGDQIKAYATKVRNGLNYHCDKDETVKDTDWLRLVKQAAENAHSKGEFSPEVILRAVAETLRGEQADDSAAA